MSTKIKKYLHDIRTSIDSIGEFIGADADVNVYLNDKMLRRAVEREFEIIGEATNRILRIEPDFPLPEGRKVVALRNRLAHEYDGISDEAMWKIVVDHLPKLREEAEKLLNE